MKKFIAFLLVILALFSLASCNKVETKDSQTEPENLQSESVCYVVSNGEAVEAYTNFIWSNDYIDGYWLSGDGEYLEYEFLNVKNDIPVVTYSEDFQVVYGKSVTSKFIKIYNEEFVRIPEVEEFENIDNLPAGTYYLVAQVVKQGEYIEEEGKSECSCSEYAYKLIIK